MKKRSAREDFLDDWNFLEEPSEKSKTVVPTVVRERVDDNWADYADEDLRQRRKDAAGGKQKNDSQNRILRTVIMVAVLILCASCIGTLLGNRDSEAVLENNGQESTALATEAVTFPPVVSTTVPEISLASEPEPGTEASTNAIAPKERRYYGQKLSDKQKKAYDTILEAVTNIETSVPNIILNNAKDLNAVANAIRCDYAELFWFDGGCPSNYYTYQGYVEMTVTPIYAYTREEIIQYQVFVESQTQALLSRLAGKTEYEKVKGVYDYLVDYTAYDYAYYGKTLYELFHDGRAVCEGYARAAQYLLTKLGVEVIFVEGDAGVPGQMEAHAWNIVNVGGDYYHLDVTWGDPYSEDGTQTKNYNYLCVTDEEIGRSHKFQRGDYPPCVKNTYNYYIVEGNYLDYYDPEKLRQWLIEAKMHGVPLEFKAANESIYIDTINRLFDNHGMFDLFRESFGEAKEYRYTRYDDMYVLIIEW